MTNQPPGFVQTLLMRNDAVAAQFAGAITDAAMASIERATSERGRPLDRAALRQAVHAGVAGYLADEIATWRERKSSSTWHFDPMRRLLLVTGAELELTTVRSRIVSGPIHRQQLDAIVYTTPTHTLLIGRVPPSGVGAAGK
jgi:hypothetical protein